MSAAHAGGSESPEPSSALTDAVIEGLLVAVEAIVESDPENAERLLKAGIANVEAAGDDEMARALGSTLQDMLDDLRELPGAADRLAAYRAGRVSGIPWEQAKRELAL
ncbi:hypothetical protein ACH495_20810 [Micromonospora sp. NPDC018662]|uniref:hypothetical protein n=1 Tax=Micromonospora sp. NPDC018662 TaxID=3364238 RepID=UPI00378AD7D4